MPLTSQSYRSVATEHLQRAQNEFDNEEYFLAHYLSGLAVECYLRAYLLRIKNEFDARHDLRELAKEARFFDILPAHREADFSEKFSTLNLRWRSSHRYYSERQFLDYMTSITAEFNVKGERWKNLARTVLNLAYDIINQGEARWDNR